MRKKIAAVAMLACLGAVPAFAGRNHTAPAGADTRIHGTITSWDASSHTFRIHRADGQDAIFHWNERTQMRGTPQVGEMVKLEFERDASGNAVATRIAAKDPSEQKHRDRNPSNPSMN